MLTRFARRSLAALALASLVTLPAACGSGDGKAEVSAGSEFGSEPTISVDGKAPKDLQFSVLKEGDGAAVKAGDMLVADFKGQPWDAKDGEGTDSTYNAEPVVQQLGKGNFPPGWDSKLPGVKTGSRVMLIEKTPASSQAAGKTYVFVIDVLGALDPASGAKGQSVAPPANLPKVTGDRDPKVEIPSGSPPSGLVHEVLVKGDGPKVDIGQVVVAQYTGVLWRTGKTFDSSWQREEGPIPLSFAVGKPGIITGWSEGLVGKTVGSRVLLVVPPDKGYGDKGQPDAGITGTDTMVFVVDILGAY